MPIAVFNVKKFKRIQTMQWLMKAELNRAAVYI